MSDLPAVRTHADLEAVVERGLGTFVEVGQALAEIRDRRTYKGTHSDFDTYCRERWGFARNYADYQINAAAVVAQLPTIVGTPPPATESQARELARVPEPERAEVWQAAVERAEAEERPVTAADVRLHAAPAPVPAPDPEIEPWTPPAYDRPYWKRYLRLVELVGEMNAHRDEFRAELDTVVTVEERMRAGGEFGSAERSGDFFNWTREQCRARPGIREVRR